MTQRVFEPTEDLWDIDSDGVNSEFDFLYLKCQAEFEGTPSYSGYCTRQARESGRSLQQATISMYLPLIDAKPADKSTILTAMIKATELTETTGQSFTVFTCDQQLYKLLVQIKWAHLEKFTNFIPRLGGMHFLMAFISSIGTLMFNIGLDDLLKNFPQNFRALRIAVEELLREFITNYSNMEELQNFLATISSQSRTSKV